MREIITKKLESFDPTVDEPTPSKELPFNVPEHKGLPVGIHTISEKEYHADPCSEPSLSNSVAKIIIQRSPYHAWLAHPKLNPNYQPTNKKEFDIGRAAHSLLLEGKEKIAELEFDTFKTKVAKEARYEAYANGLTPLLSKDLYTTRQMVEVAKKFIDSHKLLKEIFANSKPEQTLIWTESNVLCRARLDILANDYKHVVDYKTTTNAKPATWSRGHIIAQGYDMQAAHYRSGIYRLTGVLPEFIFLVQENKPPYGCSVVGLENSMELVGENKIMRALKIWRECLQSGKWDSYPTDILYYIAPAYAIHEDLDMEDDNGVIH